MTVAVAGRVGAASSASGSAPTTETQRVVWARTWSASGERAMVVRVQGGMGRRRLDVDALVIAS